MIHHIGSSVCTSVSPHLHGHPRCAVDLFFDSLFLALFLSVCFSWTLTWASSSVWSTSGQLTTGTTPTEESGPLAENTPLTGYHSAENKFERFSGGFLELISKFEFEFRRRGNFFLKDSTFWCVQSSITHTPCGCPCVCAVACLHPHNSNSKVVASVTNHDNIYTNIFIYINI